MKRVINIVEDEKDINNLVAQYLRKEGYEVHSYYTYEEASAHVVDDDVHLWILDIMLDDKSGFDLIEEIRLQGPETPVIFMSARDKEFDRIIGLEKGCDDYITKPFSPKELVLRVNNIIKRAYRDDNNRISIDGYELDEEQRKIYADNVEIELTTKEFDLLMMFIKNKGIAFSRDKILENVWDENYFGSDEIQGPFIVYWKDLPVQEVTKLTSHTDLLPALMSSIFKVKNPVSDYAQGRNLFELNGDPWVLASNFRWNVIIQPDGTQYHIDRKGNYKKFDRTYTEQSSSRPPLGLFLDVFKQERSFVNK